MSILQRGCSAEAARRWEGGGGRKAEGGAGRGPTAHSGVNGGGGRVRDVGAALIERPQTHRCASGTGEQTVISRRRDDMREVFAVVKILPQMKSHSRALAWSATTAAAGGGGGGGGDGGGKQTSC